MSDPDKYDALAAELLPCLEGVCMPDLHDELCGRRWRFSIAAELRADGLEIEQLKAQLATAEQRGMERILGELSVALADDIRADIAQRRALTSLVSEGS